jgi:predicted PurR-regulated permease PerM
MPDAGGRPGASQRSGDGEGIYDRIRTAGRTAWALVGIALLLAVFGLLLWVLRALLAPLVLAGAIVFLLNPIVTRLHRRGLPRVLGTTISYLGVAATVGIVILLITPLVRDQADQLSDEFPQVREDVEDQINEWSATSKEDNWLIEIPSVGEIEDEVGGGNSGDLSAQVTSLRRIATRVFEVALIFILGPIIAFYLLVDLPHVRRLTEAMIPPRAKPEVLLVAHRLSQTIGGFFRGQLAVAFIVGVMVSIGLAIIGLPFWLLIGMIAGVFNMIPLIGPWIGAVPGIVIALTTRDVGTAVWVAVVMTVAQQIDNHFISPLVMRRAVRLHPAVVMMALLAGGTLGGFFGLLIAVPLTATLKIIVGHLWRTYVLGDPVPGLDLPVDAPAARPASPD